MKIKAAATAMLEWKITIFVFSMLAIGMSIFMIVIGIMLVKEVVEIAAIRVLPGMVNVVCN